MPDFQKTVIFWQWAWGFEETAAGAAQPGRAKVPSNLAANMTVIRDERFCWSAAVSRFPGYLKTIAWVVLLLPGAPRTGFKGNCSGRILALFRVADQL
ncbi:MAG: hypothetical protein AAFW82_03130, partial [Pseudomonadota bacterium]